MRGRFQDQGGLFLYIQLEKRIRTNHPLAQGPRARSRGEELPAALRGWPDGYGPSGPCRRRAARKMIFWSGLSLNRSGWEVQHLQIYS